MLLCRFFTKCVYRRNIFLIQSIRMFQVWLPISYMVVLIEYGNLLFCVNTKRIQCENVSNLPRMRRRLLLRCSRSLRYAIYVKNMNTGPIITLFKQRAIVNMLLLALGPKQSFCGTANFLPAWNEPFSVIFVLFKGSETLRWKSEKESCSKRNGHERPNYYT